MNLSTGCLIIGVVYLWFLFIDRFLKSCSHYAYIQFLKGTGLEVNFLRIKWTTKAFNELLVKWGTKRPKFYKTFYCLGLITTLVMLPISVYLIFFAFFKNFATHSKTETSLITPVLPGLNIPASEMGYYSLSLLVCSVFHELGHAIAAVQEDLTIEYVGATIFFVMPVAFVNIQSDKLLSINPWNRLKVFCAGVWHNMVIALVGYLLYSSLDFVFTPFFEIGNGVIIKNIESKSPLLGPKGFSNWNVITKINDCDIKDETSWYNCLSALQMRKVAFCIESDLVHNFDESIPLRHIDNDLVSCCHADNKGRLCFEYLDSEDNVLEFPTHVCLPGRTVVEQHKDFCSIEPFTCPKDTFCFRPILGNNTNLFRIKRRNLSEVIYIGQASDFAKTISVSSYIPKYWFFSNIIPDAITKFLRYLVLFSIGLAIVNIYPSLLFDGEHIWNTLLHLMLSSHLRTTYIKIISSISSFIFTVILIIHCIIVIYREFNINDF